MGHLNMRQIERSKEKVYNAIDASFEYQELLKRVRKDSRKMKRGQLAHKYSTPDHPRLTSCQGPSSLPRSSTSGWAQ